MEKSVEIIKTQYDLYSVECLGDIDLVISNIIDLGLFAVRGAEEFTTEMTKNNTRANISRVLGDYAVEIGYRRSSYYVSDNQVVERQLNTANTYINCFNRLIGEIDEYNYEDINRLAHFTYCSYTSDMLNLAQMRKYNRARQEGLVLERQFDEVKTDSFLEFFDDAIDSISKSDVSSQMEVVVLEKK